MTAGYPKKFRLTGYAELQYNNNYFEYSTSRSSHDYSHSNFKQSLRLNFQGYIYHPRLLVYRVLLNLSYFKSLTGVDINGKDFGYAFLVTALPYRPISADLFASRDYYHFIAKTQALPDRTVTNYGARLKIFFKKLKLTRLIRLRYEHWDIDTENISENTKTDTYALSIIGSLNTIRTNYTLTSTLNSFSSPMGDIDSKYLTAFTDTAITRKGLKLITSFFYSDFQYSNDDYTKELSFNTNLDFPNGERFFHNYQYLFNKTEQFYKGSLISGTTDKLTELSHNMITGSWGFRVTDRLMTSLVLNYGNRKIDNNKGDIVGLSTNLSYRRPFAGFNTESSYRFILKKDELRYDLYDHYISINLKTKRFKPGTAYFTYTFIKSYLENKIFAEEESFFGEDVKPYEIGKSTMNSMSHSLVLGLRGRGLGTLLRRAIWTIESSYYNIKADIKRPLQRLDEFGDSERTFEEITRKTYQYSLYGQILFPIRTTMDFNSRASYAFGETDSVSRESFIMHARLNYRLRKNILFSGLIRGRWNRIQNNPDQRVIDYEASVEYFRGQLRCRLEVYLSLSDQADVTAWSRRIFLTVRRYF